jgi:hypothetical protein
LISAREVEGAIFEIEQALAGEFPELKRIYVRPQQGSQTA